MADNNAAVASAHSVALLGSTTDLGTLRTHNAVKQRQAQVADSTRRLLQSETMVNMLQEAGVELPSIEDLETGRRRPPAGGRSDWRNALNKNHGHPMPGTDVSGSGDGAPITTAEGDIIPSANATPSTAPGMSPPRSPRKKEVRGGWRQHVNREASETYEKNPVVRRLKKLRHKVLYGRVGEKAYARYRATLRANLTWRDILRPNLAVAKRNGNMQPGFSRWLDTAITEEQRRAVRDEAARVIQAAWRTFKRNRIDSVMKHVRNYEIGKYAWSDDDSVATDELPDWWDESSEDEDEDEEGKDGKKKKLKKKSGSLKRSPSMMKKRAVLAGVAAAIDEETMGEAVITAKKKKKKKKKGGGGDGSDGGEGEDGEGGEGEGGEGEEGGEDGGGGKGKKGKGRKGKKGGAGGPDGADGGEEGAGEEGAGGEDGDGGAAAGEDGDEGAGEEGLASPGKKLKGGRRKGSKGKTTPSDTAAGSGALTAEPSSVGMSPEPPQSRSPETVDEGEHEAPAEEAKQKKGKKGKKGAKGAATTAAGGGIGAPPALSTEASSVLSPPGPALVIKSAAPSPLPLSRGPSPIPPPSVAAAAAAAATAASAAASAAASVAASASVSAVPSAANVSMFPELLKSSDGNRSRSSSNRKSSGPSGNDDSEHAEYDDGEDEPSSRLDGGRSGDVGASDTGDTGGSGIDGSKSRRRPKKKRVKKKDAGASGSTTTSTPRRNAANRNDVPDWSKVGPSAALFDATTDPAKRAALLARMAHEGGPEWKTPGPVSDWYNMSHYLYDGTDPDKRAEAMAKVAETVVAAGQPLWRPAGVAVNHWFHMSRSMYDGDDPSKRAEAMARVAAAQSNPMWRPPGIGPGIGRPKYDSGLFDGPEPEKQKRESSGLTAWRPPGVPRVEYFNYVSNGPSSPSSSETDAGETLEERATRRAERRAERRAARATKAALVGEGSSSSLNGRQPWRFTYAVEEEQAPPGNEPPQTRYDNILRDEKPAPRPWKYTVVSEPDHSMPYNIWGPYVEPSGGSTQRGPKSESSLLALRKTASETGGGSSLCSRSNANASTPGGIPAEASAASVVPAAAVASSPASAAPPAAEAGPVAVAPPPLDLAAVGTDPSPSTTEVGADAAPSPGTAAATTAATATAAAVASAAPPPLARPAGAEGVTRSDTDAASPRRSPRRPKHQQPPNAQPHPHPHPHQQQPLLRRNMSMPHLDIPMPSIRRTLSARYRTAGSALAIPSHIVLAPEVVAAAAAAAVASLVAVSTYDSTAALRGLPYELSVMGRSAVQPGRPAGLGADDSSEGASCAGELSEDEERRARSPNLMRVGNATLRISPRRELEAQELGGAEVEAAAAAAGVVMGAAEPSGPVVGGELAAGTAAGAGGIGREASVGADGQQQQLLEYQLSEQQLQMERSQLEKEQSLLQKEHSQHSQHSQLQWLLQAGGQMSPEASYYNYVAGAAMQGAQPPVVPPLSLPLQLPAGESSALSHSSRHHRNNSAYASDGGLGFTAYPSSRHRSLPWRRSFDVPTGESSGTYDTAPSGRRDRTAQGLYPPALSSAVDSTVPKRVCSARRRGAFTTAGIQPYPLDPALFRSLPAHLLARGRTRSAPGSPRGAFLAADESALAAAADSAGGAADGSADPMALTAGLYGYGDGNPAAAAAQQPHSSTALSRDDLPPLPAILQDPRAQEFLTSRGTRILAQRRLAAKGTAQPDPRAMYELLLLGRCVRQHQQDQYLGASTSTGAGGGGGGGGGGVGFAPAAAAGPAVPHLVSPRRRNANGSTTTTNGGGGSNGGSLAEAHKKAQVKLASTHPMARMYNMHGVDPNPYGQYTWSRSGQPYGTLGDTEQQQPSWGPAAAAATPTAWGPAEQLPLHGAQQAVYAQPHPHPHHAAAAQLPPVRATSLPPQPQSHHLLLSASYPAAAAQPPLPPLPAGLHPSADLLRRSTPPPAPPASAPPSSRAGVTVHAPSSAYTQYTFSVPGAGGGSAGFAADAPGVAAKAASRTSSWRDLALVAEAPSGRPAGSARHQQQQGQMGRGGSREGSLGRLSSSPGGGNGDGNGNGHRPLSREELAAGATGTDVLSGMAPVAVGGGGGSLQAPGAAGEGGTGGGIDMAPWTLLPPLASQSMQSALPGGPQPQPPAQQPQQHQSQQQHQLQLQMQLQPTSQQQQQQLVQQSGPSQSLQHQQQSQLQQQLFQNGRGQTPSGRAPTAQSSSSALGRSPASATRLPAVGQRRLGPPPATPTDVSVADGTTQRNKSRGQLRTGRAPLGAPLSSRVPERPPPPAT